MRDDLMMRKAFFKVVIGSLFLGTSSFVLAKSENSQGFDAMKARTHEFLDDSKVPSYSGKVTESFESGGYTYLKFQTKDQEYWAATNSVPIKNGDKIILKDAFPMHGFHSKSLNRTFDLILFASEISKVE